MEKETMEALEKIVTKYNLILNSKEYRFGIKCIEFKNLLKKGKFLTILKKIIVHNKIKKYEAHEQPFFSINNTPIQGKKIVIYSCIVGEYDKIREPVFKNSYCDYILFTDNLEIQTTGWSIELIPQEIKNQYLNNNVLVNRYYKLNPHILFPNYDYAIYVDGNIEIVSDLTPLIHNIGSLGIALHKHRFRNCLYDELEACKILKKGNQEKLQEQIEKYKKENFPSQYGMAECGLIVTDIKKVEAKEILEKWFFEFLHSSSLRDQIALPYVLWKKNIALDQITTLGNNIYQNPKIIIHKNHNQN